MPQLTYVPAEAPLIELGTLAEGVAVVAEPIEVAGGVAWRPALNAALTLAVPTAAVCFLMATMGEALAFFWMIGAAALAVMLYRKRTRIRTLPAGAGARIGLITGMLASWVMLAITGISVWGQRFLFHQGGQMDADWNDLVEKNLQLWQQTYVQMGMASATAAQSGAITKNWMLSPEGHAGAIFFNFVFSAGVLTLFAMLGGALSARLANSRSGPVA